MRDRRPAGRAIRWLRASGWLYVGLIGAWLLTRGLILDRLWWLALLNSAALALFQPLVVLLPLALGWRQWRLLLGLMVPVVAFASLFGDLLLPPLAAPPPGPPLTVMTYNVLWSNLDYGRLAEAIRAAEADIVALQELRPSHLPALSAALGDRLPYSVDHPLDQYHSVGLLSRFPIEAVTPLPDPPVARGLLVRLRVGERSLTVIAAHLIPTNPLDQGLSQLPTMVSERYARRRAEVDTLLAAVRESAQPAIILCDCNFTDTSENYARLSTVLHDSAAVAGWGLRRTLPSPFFAWPAQRYDYVWYTADLVATDAFVGLDGGSDHLPFVARLVWRPPLAQGRGG